MHNFEEGTGLPELPRDCYWHVRKDKGDWSYVEVFQDRKPLFGIFPRHRVHLSMIVKDHEICTAEGLMQMTTKALWLYGDDFKASMALLNTPKINPYGDYPPKKVW